METLAAPARRHGSFRFRVDYLLRLHGAARRAFARTSFFSSEARIQSPQGKRTAESQRPPEETGCSVASKIQAGGVAGQAESGRRNSPRSLFPLGRCKFLAPSI